MKLNPTKIIRYLPLLAPIPEAGAVYLSLDREMTWHPAFSVVSALIVAGTGFWGVQVMNAMAEYNATLKRGEEKELGHLPTWKAMLVLAVWFTGVTLLTVFLDILPALKTWTPLGLVVIGFSAAYLFSLSNLHETRLQERVAYRQKIVKDKEAADRQRESERKERKEQQQAIAIKRKEIAARMQDSGVRKQVKSGAKLDDATLLLEWTIDPHLTDTGMANKLMAEGRVKKITRQAVSQRREKMIANGLIVKTPDGRVVEVLHKAESEVSTDSGTGVTS